LQYGDNLTIRVDHRSFSSKWFILCEGGKSHCVSIQRQSQCQSKFVGEQPISPPVQRLTQ